MILCHAIARDQQERDQLVRHAMAVWGGVTIGTLPSGAILVMDPHGERYPRRGDVTYRLEPRRAIPPKRMENLHAIRR